MKNGVYQYYCVQSLKLLAESTTKMVTVVVLARQEEKKDGEEEEEVKVDTFKFIGVRRLKGECLVRMIKGQ